MKRVAEGAIPPMPRFGEKPEETEEGTPLRDWVQVALPRASMGVEPRQFLPAPQGMIGYSTPLCRAKAVPPAPPRDWPMAAMLDDQAMAAIAVAPATDLGGLPLPVELPRLDRPAHFAWASTCVSGIIRLEPELTPSELATVPQVKWAARVEGLFVPRLRFRTWRPRLVAGPRPEGMDISRGAFRLRPAAIPETRTIAPSPTILRMTAPKPQAPGPLPARPAPLTFNPKPLRNADHE
jgi:hypothetical protein